MMRRIAASPACKHCGKVIIEQQSVKRITKDQRTSSIRWIGCIMRNLSGSPQVIIIDHAVLLVDEADLETRMSFLQYSMLLLAVSGCE